MGSAEDIVDAEALWNELEKTRVVGIGADKFKSYIGSPPHGKVLESLQQLVTVNGHTGIALVKKIMAALESQSPALALIVRNT